VVDFSAFLFLREANREGSETRKTRMISTLPELDGAEPSEKNERKNGS
jgi:hypothetical protein